MVHMRILLIENELAAANDMVTFLTGKGYTVAHAPNTQTAKELLPTTNWGAVLLDWLLPDGEGIDLLPMIRKQADQASIIMISSKGLIADRIKGLDAGADDYMVKPCDPNELLARLRAIERRRSGAASAILECGTLRIDLGRNTVTANGVPANLTGKEWAILRVLASRPDRLHSKEVLTSAIYTFDDDIGSNTLEVFISHLRRKLGRDTIQTYRGQGYRLSGYIG
jgi:two-component system, OmpR family, response regulator